MLLRREGWDLGKHRLYRIYREEGLFTPKTTLAACIGGPPRGAVAIGGTE
jgi:hypothetical protein